MTTWHETPEIAAAVAAYKRWLTTEIEKLPDGLRMGDVRRSDVLELLGSPDQFLLVCGHSRRQRVGDMMFCPDCGTALMEQDDKP